MKRDSSEGYISDKSSSNEAVDQLSPDTNERAGRRGEEGWQPIGRREEGLREGFRIWNR